MAMDVPVRLMSGKVSILEIGPETRQKIPKSKRHISRQSLKLVFGTPSEASFSVSELPQLGRAGVIFVPIIGH